LLDQDRKITYKSDKGTTFSNRIIKFKLMKTIFLKCFMLSFFILLFISSCESGKADKDGNKSLEGPADPANRGGKLGGPQTTPQPLRSDSVNTTTGNEKTP
jgi:hypothetical protein